MQIYALGEKGKLIGTQQASRCKDYFCFECQSVVRLRGGPWRQLHFYHISPNKECTLCKKSLIHLQVQYALKKMLAQHEVLLEKRFGEINRIADVVWLAKKVIFEVQCSTISPEEIEERNLDYQQIGYFVVWILHDSRYNRYKLSSAEYYLLSHPHYFTNINHLGEGMFYDQYAYVKGGRRVKRTARLPIHLKELCFLKKGESLSHQPYPRRQWALAFKGDLFHRAIAYPSYLAAKKRLSPLKWLRSFLRIFFHLLLEKAGE